MVKKTEKEKIIIEAEKRKVFGRKVKKLRREGILPANIYGNKIKSLAIQVFLKDFLPVYQKVGETGIVEVKVAGEEKTRPTLIHNVQKDVISEKPIHVDFHQVSLIEKTIVKIPVEIVGNAPAVEQKKGVLIQTLGEIEVEALPTNLPDQFSVDVSGLKEVDQTITVGDLRPPAGVKILTSQEQILVKIEPPVKEETTSSPPTEGVSTTEKTEEEKPAECNPPQTENSAKEEKSTEEKE